MFFGLFAILLLAFGIVLAACVVSFGAVGVCLIAHITSLPFAALPAMPYWCGAILGLSLLALCALSVAGCVWFFSFFRQIFRAYGRFHQNMLAPCYGAVTLPSLPMAPQMSAPARRRLRRLALTALCAVLLGGNLLRYGIVYPFVLHEVKLPVEFSTVAYFAVPAILLTSRKRLHSWAAYSGLMAGFFYYLTMILAGGPLFAAHAPGDVYISLFCHGAVYFCGFVTIGTEECRAKDAPKLALNVALVALRAALLRPLVAGSEGLLIYILLDAAPVRYALPQSAWRIALPVYYIAVAAFVLLTIRGFFRTNRRQYRKFSALRAA